VSSDGSRIRLLALGVDAETLFEGQGELRAFVEVPESADELLEALRELLGNGGQVVALVPEWFPAEGAAQLGIARSLLDTPSVAVCATAKPPLAATVLVALLSALAPRLGSAGRLAAAVPWLEERLQVFAWLGSASGLTDPAPTVFQHAASILPGAAFGVSTWPEPSVRRLTRRNRGVPLPAPREGIGLATAARGGDREWVEEVVLAGLGDPPVLELEPTSHGPAWWGTARLVETVAYPLDVEVLARELGALETWLCEWCGQQVASSPCPLCGAVREHVEPRSEAASG
jgi:hypothetical protein